MQGDYPIYVPDEDELAEKLVTHAHSQTLHGGALLTMTKIREKILDPKTIDETCDTKVPWM